MRIVLQTTATAPYTHYSTLTRHCHRSSCTISMTSYPSVDPSAYLLGVCVSRPAAICGHTIYGTCLIMRCCKTTLDVNFISQAVFSYFSPPSLGTDQDVYSGLHSLPASYIQAFRRLICIHRSIFAGLATRNGKGYALSVTIGVSALIRYLHKFPSE